MNRFRIISLAVLFVFILGYGTAWWASSEPELFDVKDLSAELSPEHKQTVGYTTTSALIKVLETLLTKNAGFLSNVRVLLAGVSHTGGDTGDGHH